MRLFIEGNPGNFPVTDIASRALKFSAKSRYITATLPPLVSLSSSSPNAYCCGDLPENMIFTDSSMGSSFTHCIWDFGNPLGSVYDYNATVPTYTYLYVGKYNISLKVSNSAGYSLSNATMVIL